MTAERGPEPFAEKGEAAENARESNIINLQEHQCFGLISCFPCTDMRPVALDRKRETRGDGTHFHSPQQGLKGVESM